MGKCVQCEDFYPPHYMVEVEVKDEKVKMVEKCAFCYLDKTEVTTVNDETGHEEKITKKEAAKRYKIFMKKLMENKNIAEVIQKGKAGLHVKG